LTNISKFHDFKGKVVCITGGSRGIGHSMSLAFAECGAKVAVASRKIDSCEETVAEIRKLGSDGSAHACHVGKWDDCNRLYEEVYAKWGRCDVLINNAGLSPLAPSLLETTEDLFDKVISVNLKGPFRLTALFATRMAQGEGGSVINVSSTGSIRPAAHNAPYSAAKAGLNALTVTQAQEYGPKVRVNCIIPGPFRTDISKAWFNDEFRARAKQNFPLERGGEPEECVGAALYFAGPASTFTTGTTLIIDGGSSNPWTRSEHQMK